MPLLFNEKTETGFIGVWKISEALKQLESKVSLTEIDVIKLSTITNSSKKSQFLATRALLNNLSPNLRIRYNDSGKPICLEPHKFISISHSEEYAAVIVSKNECGIDIEKVSDKTSRIKSRFLSEREIALSMEKQDTLTLFWAVKEAAYKLAGVSGLSFKNNIRISNQDLEKKTIKGELLIGSSITKNLIFYWKPISDHILVYVTE